MPITTTGAGVYPASGGAAWTPASLGSALKAWYKADAGVYNDAGTTLATNGQTVRQWNDQSGNGYHVTQATSASRPTYLTNTLNSLPVIDFTNVVNQQYLQTTTTPVVLGGTLLSAFFVRKVTGLNGNTNVRLLAISVSSDDTSPSTAIVDYCPGSSITTPRTHNNGDKSTGTISSGTWNQIGTIFDGANDIMYIANSAQTGVAATPTFAAAVDIDVFAEHGGTAAIGQCAEIIFTNTALSSGDRNSLATYFTNKWGV